jgi:hypothetical protein
MPIRIIGEQVGIVLFGDWIRSGIMRGTQEIVLATDGEYLCVYMNGFVCVYMYMYVYVGEWVS